jgi:hypothetical protein
LYGGEWKNLSVCWGALFRDDDDQHVGVWSSEAFRAAVTFACGSGGNPGAHACSSTKRTDPYTKQAYTSSLSTGYAEASSQTAGE